MSNAKKFEAIFDGHAGAYGTFTIEGKKENGKSIGRANVVRSTRTTDLFEGHLSGDGVGMGIIPINEDNNCKWGCIDVDEYPLDHKRLLDKIRAATIPLVVCRSKSGGAHLFLFSTEWTTAEKMRDTLQHLASSLGYGGCEIFPKQIRLVKERGDVGNFLNMPYYDAEDGLRYAFNNDGTAATLDEFFELYETYKQTPEQIVALAQEDLGSNPVMDGPPCLQSLCASKISEGGRNNGLFSIGVYLRKAHADTWQDEILNYNMAYIDPPLPLSEVNAVVKQLEKNDYAYRCNDSPIQPYCNKELCRTRKYGIGAIVSDTAIANLRKYDSKPPIWFLDVNGQPLELETDALQNQALFQKACIDQLNFMPQSMKKIDWEARINHLMNEMTETGQIIPVSEDSSIEGHFQELVREFCVGNQAADTKNDILLKKPWLDAENNRAYFKLAHLEAFLRKNHFTEYKRNKLSRRLQDMGADDTAIKIHNKSVRVWRLPIDGINDQQIVSPSFGGGEAPF
jgi:hypothetical protein